MPTRITFAGAEDLLFGVLQTWAEKAAKLLESALEPPYGRIDLTEVDELVQAAYALGILAIETKASGFFITGWDI